MRTLQNPTPTKAVKEHKCDFCVGTIKKGETYLKSSHYFDGFYTWKTHTYCNEIASKLKFYEEADYGVTTEDFLEGIKHEYQKIMSDHYTELYESKSFIYPMFEDVLKFVLKHHNISND